MPYWFIDTPEPKGYTEHFALLPTRAMDTYTGRYAWVWLRTVRRWDHNGDYDFCSFGM